MGGRPLYFGTVASYSRQITIKGAYYTEVGYQRKGMGAPFYEDYRGEYYAQRERFLALPRYLDDDDRPELLPNLLRNFVESYEPGRSILWVSR